MKVKKVSVQSVVLCFILNQPAAILRFIDVFCSMKIKSYLISEDDKKSWLLG